MRQRCCVPYITGTSNWDWLIVGQEWLGGAKVSCILRGCLGEAKMLCTLYNWDVQLRLAYSWAGMVGWCEGVMYLTSPGRTTDTVLQLGKACWSCSIKVEGECFYFFCFFPFIPVPLSSLSISFISSAISFLSFSAPLLSLLSLFSLSLGDDTKWPTRVDVSLNPNTISQYYRWARPAIFAAGKGRRECFYFFCFFTFIHFPLSPLSLFFISSSVSSISLLPFSGANTKWPTRVDVSLITNT